MKVQRACFARFRGVITSSLNGLCVCAQIRLILSIILSCAHASGDSLVLATRKSSEMKMSVSLVDLFVSYAAT